LSLLDSVVFTVESCLGKPYNSRSICLTNPIPPVTITTKKTKTTKIVGLSTRVANTCHSITNFIVRGNPENNKIITHVIYLISGKVWPSPLI